MGYSQPGRRRRGRQNPGKRVSRRDERQIQWHGGCLRGGIEVADLGHRASRRKNRKRRGRDAKCHAVEQRALYCGALAPAAIRATSDPPDLGHFS